MQKKPITEANAAAAIMDGVFSQVDERWFQVEEPLFRMVQEAGFKPLKPDFVRFNFALAMLAVNFRTAFDVLPRPQAERIFTHMLNFLEQQLGVGNFIPVRNTLLKFIEAYNNGILAIRDPLHDVAMLLYYKMGLENTPQVVVDETYYIPEPHIVDYLNHSMVLFAGKWEYLLERFFLVTVDGVAEEHGPPPTGPDHHDSLQ